MATMTADWPFSIPTESAGLSIKSYFVDKIGSARELARRELGENALLLRAGETAPEEQGRGRYEVVFAAPPPAISAPQALAPPEPAPATAAKAMESAAVGEFLVRAGLSKLLTLTPRLHPVFEELVGRGFDYGEACTHVVALQRRSLAASRDGLHRISGALEGGDDSTLEQLLEEELANQLQCDSRIGVNEGGRRIIMLIGPPGAGKTSTLAKLAVQVGLVKRRNLHFISMDSHTLGGGRLLRSFAEALGVDHSVCRTNAELTSTLEHVRNKDLVLVDSPGYSPSDIGGAADLAALVRGNEEIDTHLVLPAPTSLGDLMSAARRFDIFGPAKLAFTKLDECNSPAAAYGLATQLGRPVSFLSMGPRIPEDLEPATSGRILHLLLHGRTLEIAAAA